MTKIDIKIKIFNICRIWNKFIYRGFPYREITIFFIIKFFFKSIVQMTVDMVIWGKSSTVLQWFSSREKIKLLTFIHYWFSYLLSRLIFALTGLLDPFLAPDLPVSMVAFMLNNRLGYKHYQSFLLITYILFFIYDWPQVYIMHYKHE